MHVDRHHESFREDDGTATPHAFITMPPGRSLGGGVRRVWGLSHTWVEGVASSVQEEVIVVIAVIVVVVIVVVIVVVRVVKVVVVVVVVSIVAYTLDEFEESSTSHWFFLTHLHTWWFLMGNHSIDFH